ncbi:MAG: hypothetical protein EOO61_03615 [Hymenobacter sp.]|nr:MAG: hypothetical protein EOO61_03615 [Hymenobacter sp.]
MPDWAQSNETGGYLPAFLKRESDDRDYYEFKRDGLNSSENTILALTLLYPSTGKEIVKAVYKDHSLAFPVNQRLLEIFGVDPEETKPHNLFTEMVYDPKSQTLSGEPGFKFPQKTIKKDLWARVTDDEADAIETWLDSIGARDRRIFNDTMAIDHADDLYAKLTVAFNKMFGKDRADVILAMSK